MPYFIVPFEKQGIQGNAEKFKDTTYASVLVPSIIAHTDPVKILMDAMANSRKFLSIRHNKYMKMRSKHAATNLSLGQGQKF